MQTIGNDKGNNNSSRNGNNSGNRKGKNNRMAIVHVAFKSSSQAPPAAAHAHYIARDGQYQQRGGVELVESGNMPEFAKADPHAFWVAADTHERANGRTYTELQIALPRELDPAQREELARDATRELLGDRFAYTMAVHVPLARDNIDQPHMHLMFSERAVTDATRAIPEERFFKRNGAKKDPEWNDRNKPEEVREKWVAMMNAAMQKAGIEGRLDARSWSEQGRNDLASLREEKTLQGSGPEAMERHAEIDQLRRERAELPPPHLDRAAAIQFLEQQAEQQIAEVQVRVAGELSRLDKLIPAARALATEVKDRTVAAVQKVTERMEQFRGRFELWREDANVPMPAAERPSVTDRAIRAVVPKVEPPVAETPGPVQALAFLPEAPAPEGAVVQHWTKWREAPANLPASQAAEATTAYELWAGKNPDDSARYSFEQYRDFRIKQSIKKDLQAGTHTGPAVPKRHPDEAELIEILKAKTPQAAALYLAEKRLPAPDRIAFNGDIQKDPARFANIRNERAHVEEQTAKRMEEVQQQDLAAAAERTAAVAAAKVIEGAKNNNAILLDIAQHFEQSTAAKKLSRTETVVFCDALFGPSRGLLHGELGRGHAWLENLEKAVKTWPVGKTLKESLGGLVNLEVTNKDTGLQYVIVAVKEKVVEFVAYLREAAALQLKRDSGILRDREHNRVLKLEKPVQERSQKLRKDNSLDR